MKAFCGLYKNSVCSKIIKGFLFVLASVIVGMLLIILSYTIPVERIKHNVEYGSGVMLDQGSSYIYAGEYTAAVLDNSTDALILGEVAYRADSVIESAVKVPSLIYPGDEGPVYSLFSYFHDDPDGYVMEYARYWHGYVVLLKPFFYFFDFADFRILNQGVQLFLIMAVVYLFIIKKQEKYLLGFMPMLVFWNPATIGISLQYAPCFYISMIGTIFAFFLKKDNLWKLFLFLGILTAYFDFLTYPLVTLAVPLETFLIVNEKSFKGMKEDILTLVEGSAFWGGGYAGMWGMKWVVGSILIKQNLFADAIYEAKIRAGISMGTENNSRLDAVTSIIQKSLFHWPYIIMLVSVLVVIILIYRKSKPDFRQINSVIVFLVIAIMPFVWYFVMSDHSYVHPRLVYRSLGISIYAGFTAIIMFLSKGEKTK